jgi:hypothetical protein
MENKQTSLEFYRSNLMALVSTGKTDFKTEPEIFEKAKEMQLQDIIEAYIAGSISLTSKNDAEQYYNETFNK